MRQVLCLLGIALVLCACDKASNNDDSADTEIYGRYKGTFNRSGMDTVQVEFFFKEDKTYEGSGGQLNYPAICRGTYLQTGNMLTVNDICAWTANFDWTLIFDGNYSVSSIGANSVRIWRTSGAVTDEYLLNKITR